MLHLADRWVNGCYVICIASTGTTSGELDWTELAFIEEHWTGLAFIWWLANQLKAFVEIACNLEMTVGMSVAHENVLCPQHSLQYHFLCIYEIGQSY